MDEEQGPLTDAQFNAVRHRLVYAQLGNGGETFDEVIADARTLPAVSDRDKTLFVVMGLIQEYGNIRARAARQQFSYVASPAQDDALAADYLSAIEQRLRQVLDSQA